MSNEHLHAKHEAMTNVIYATPGMLPNRYVFVVTNLCNLKCRFCFQARDKRADAMRLEDWLNVARQLPSYARVTLTGGEPLMFPGFKELFVHVAERFDCNMITNGLLLDEQTIDLLLEHPKFRVLSISMDGLNNKSRGVSEGQWQRVEAMLRYFVERKAATGSNCVLDIKALILDENAESLFELYRHCVEEIGCNSFAFQLLKGSSMQHADVMYPFDDIFKESPAPVYKNFPEILRQLKRVREYSLKTGTKAFLHPKVASLMSDADIGDIDYINRRTFPQERFLPCRAPWSSIHINVDGDVFPCLAVPMGNVKTMPLEKIIHGEAFSRFKETIRERGEVAACNRCGWLKPAPPDATVLPRSDVV
ncbi:MAG: radical SAM protein [Verrucomicrobia bacterium]|jgi:MoaA/NifB/PqqE/SkfB family radical SAM enzyme|nr:radical SAM protein [Verrucomicrobiota bacterium]MBT7068228.1 radical SAM protein [Verrucomicrobiota bacterium]MBT7699636.1 radical SAM protein [Verrucomicrobiota bacterium]